MNNLVVLVSPPASGKTFWIKNFSNELCAKDILMVSPLRALADECRSKWDDGILVVTPEEWLFNQQKRSVVIFDEYHLYYYWGDHFRPVMWEVFYELSAQADLVILLSATISQEMKEEVLFFKNSFDKIYWCDYGNQQLKFSPKRYFVAPSRNWLSHFICLGPRGSGVNLIFCAFRQEVNFWEEKLISQGFKVWSCVGGEAGEMSKKMTSKILPDFIVATSVLSHGVNLPPISCIYFLYPLKNLDFWIQMIARGGRQGEDYEVFSLERPHGIRWSFYLNFLAIVILSLKMNLVFQWREIRQWILKE